MATKNNPDKLHLDMITKYLSEIEKPTLEDFIHNVPVEIHIKIKDIRQYWTGHYKKVATILNKEFVPGDPDWYDLMVKCKNKESEVAITDTDPTPSSSSSKKTSFIEKMKETHEKIKNNKWQLPSGVYAEDRMLEYCNQLDYEHAGHSFILDTSDTCWEGVFEPSDLEYIKTFSPPTLATIDDDDINMYINSFSGKTSYNAIMEHVTRHQPFSADENYDITWLRQTIMMMMSNHRSNFYTKAGPSETDILCRVWSSIQYSFDDTDITVFGGEQESVATSENNNANRTLGKRKNHGTRIDLRFIYDGMELGGAEAGRQDEGVGGTKELVEGQLKCPKTLRDMLIRLCTKYMDKKEKLMTFGFIMMGFSISLMVMDCPGGNVCRVVRAPRYSVTSDIISFTTRVLPLLKFFLSIKHTLLRVVHEIQSSKPPAPTLGLVDIPQLAYAIPSSSSSSSKVSASTKTSASKTSSSKTPTSSVSSSKKQRQSPY
ncbi:hypothetical protein BDA99DRAFT_531259 [Phascolomyces articulosus]|uniref:Uncharacterized protein n=1 Tax=Phascolomyces articulosus TaxID=60185 RepID=A0AAD5KBZ5_9FUNG|nr:hypothetical protein BDA99DRAFT_531259 [Phascolomyces articulosus]